MMVALLAVNASIMVALTGVWASDGRGRRIKEGRQKPRVRAVITRFSLPETAVRGSDPNRARRRGKIFLPQYGNVADGMGLFRDPCIEN